MTPRHRFGGNSHGCIRCDDCPSISVICDVQQWRHRLACLFLGVVLPWFTSFSSATTATHCSSAAWNDDKHGRTMIACDAWRLIVNAPDVRRRCWPVAIHIRLFYALCIICQVSFCSICFQGPGFIFPDQPSASNYHIHRRAPTRQLTYIVWKREAPLSPWLSIAPARGKGDFEFVKDRGGWRIEDFRAVGETSGYGLIQMKTSLSPQFWSLYWMRMEWNNKTSLGRWVVKEVEIYWETKWYGHYGKWGRNPLARVI